MEEMPPGGVVPVPFEDPPEGVSIEGVPQEGLSGGVEGLCNITSEYTQLPIQASVSWEDFGM